MIAPSPLLDPRLLAGVAALDELAEAVAPDRMGVHYSSLNPNWRTEAAVFAWWHRLFDFDVDAAASAASALLPRYFSAGGLDALTTRWAEHGDRFWMNPPYGNSERACGPRCTKKVCQRRGHHLTADKPGIERFVAAARRNCRADHLRAVLLIPARSDTRYWHDLIADAEAIHFVKGRLYFEDDRDTREPAPFPSAFVVLGPQGYRGAPRVHTWDYNALIRKAGE